MMSVSRVITALDFAKAADALAFAETVDPKLSRVKVGKELFTRAGPQVVTDLHSMGFEVFLDLKFHDIPNTVAGAVRAACELGVWMVNVHASGGKPMLTAAADAVKECGSKTLLIGVTVLTSMNDDDVAAVGYANNAAEQAVRLAKLTAESGLDGVVCSPQEVPIIRRAVEPISQNFITVTPGVRPETLNSNDDQRRIMTPLDAIKNGSDYLVIGRPITQADVPNETLSSIIHDLREAV